MKALKTARVLEAIAQFGKRDKELFEELTKKLGEPAKARKMPVSPALAAAYEKIPSPALEVRMLAESTPEPAPPEQVEVSAYEKRVAETIVRANARPVLVIHDNKVTTEFIGPDSQVWASRIDKAKSVLDIVIPAVGRVEVGNNPDYTWLGTGWLVADDTIVTNRHVAREFARNGSTGFVFRVGANGGLQAARIDFLEEYQRSASLEFAVDSILWIATPNGPDVAFLRLRRPSSARALPKPIPLADSVQPDDFVVTIGYPARDPRVPDQDLVKRIFGDVYEKKRLAPGRITEVGPDELQHDCSTLGGNSGSPVLNLNGAAVGLHFSGLFLEANYAVPAPTLKELLAKVQRSELPGMGPAELSSGSGGSGSPKPAGPTVTEPGCVTFDVQIPLQITVRVGNIARAASVTAGVAATPVPPGIDYPTALRAAQEALSGRPGVLEVRLGYRFKRGWITDERVIVVEVRQKLDVGELRETGAPMIPAQFLGVGVDVRTAALADQLEHLGVDLEALEARAKPGAYREPPNLELDAVEEPMKALFHVSPDSGFPNLRAFLGRVKKSLTATMYEWEATQVSDAIAAAIQPGNRVLKMVTQKQGTAAAVDAMARKLGSKFKHVWASVGSGALFPMAYHIKVASRDEEEFWLSSGNWKDSNQPDIDPAGENTHAISPLRDYNREWHVIVQNKKLATLFRKYIEWDFEEAKRVPAEEHVEIPSLELFVPEVAFAEAPERRIAVNYNDPLEVERVLKVQPLLTPDRDARGRRKFIDVVTALVKQATRKIYVQNQSFNLLDDNVDEFEQFMGALKEKQQGSVDVKIIFRDSREFGRGAIQAQQKLLERLKGFGFNMNLVKIQKKLHAKGIICDPPDAEHPQDGVVVLGSENITNLGMLYNRDASLVVYGPDVAAYFEKIFMFDWDTLATQEADELIGGLELAVAGQETPPGYRRVSLRELLGLD